jgi:hypothetical protein
MPALGLAVCPFPIAATSPLRAPRSPWNVLELAYMSAVHATPPARSEPGPVRPNENSSTTGRAEAYVNKT